MCFGWERRPPKAALGDVKELDAFCKENQSVKIATVQGRLLAMDRDKRWERTKLAYDAYSWESRHTKTSDAVTAVSEAYERGENDEFYKAHNS
jgi:2,3-bisphosphoglycerate-independent phosphoglycerate mutase